MTNLIVVGKTYSPHPQCQVRVSSSVALIIVSATAARPPPEPGILGGVPAVVSAEKHAEKVQKRCRKGASAAWQGRVF